MIDKTNVINGKTFEQWYKEAQEVSKKIATDNTAKMIKEAQEAEQNIIASTADGNEESWAEYFLDGYSPEEVINEDLSYAD